MSQYLKRDIARIFKKRPNTIEYYTSSGLVIPDIEPSQGRGKPRVYSGRNLIEFGMIEVMQRMGISLSTVDRVLGILRKGEWSPDGFVEVMEKKGVEAAVDWKRHNIISFRSFWKSDEWGIKKELVFLDVQGLTSSGELCFEEWVEVVEKAESDTGFRVNRVFDPEASVVKILWLGSIKRAAERMILH